MWKSFVHDLQHFYTWHAHALAKISVRFPLLKCEKAAKKLQHNQQLRGISTRRI